MIAGKEGNLRDGVVEKAVSPSLSALRRSTAAEEESLTMRIAQRDIV